jgi:hypothetical protein
MKSRFDLHNAYCVTTGFAYGHPIGPDYTLTNGGAEIVSVDEYDENRQGDFKSPNQFGFSILRAQAGPYSHIERGNWSAQPADISTTGLLYDRGNSLTSLLPTDFAVTLDSAMAKIYDQIRGNSNTVVDLAESGATLKMLKNAISVRKQLKKFLTDVVRHKKYQRLSKGQQRLDYASDKWLEYRYGWMPLISSTYEALQQLGKKVDGGLVIASGRSSREVSVEDETRSGDGSYTSPRDSWSIKLRYRTEVSIQFRLPEGQQVYDWTSLNPLGIAWELAPLSFVADWFVNVGDTLALWENYVLFANKFVRGYRTDSFREDVRYSTKGSTAYPVYYWPGTDVPFDGPSFRSVSKESTAYRLYKSRVVLHALPFPEAGLRLNVNLNSKRMLDACGLIHTLTRDFFRKR